MKCCLKCEHARYACNKAYVGCSFWEKKLQTEDIDLNDIMIKLDLNQLATGWVFMGRYPEKKDSYTTAEGIMTNGVICFEKDFVCDNYKRRG